MSLRMELPQTHWAAEFNYPHNKQTNQPSTLFLVPALDVSVCTCDDGELISKWHQQLSCCHVSVLSQTQKVSEGLLPQCITPVLEQFAFLGISGMLEAYTGMLKLCICRGSLQFSFYFCMCLWFFSVPRVRF